MNSKTVILAGSVYTPSQHLKDTAVFIEDGRFAGCGPASRQTMATVEDRAQLLARTPAAALGPPAPRERWLSAAWLEAWDKILVPGFVEVHTNGIGGYDAMDPKPGALDGMARVLARFGTTTFLPTLISAPKPDLLRGLTSLAREMNHTQGGATPAGIHLEGPFLSRKKRGAHLAVNLQRPTRRFFADLVAAAEGHLKILTLAPELNGALAVIRAAERAGVVPALGHSNATHEQTRQAIDAGARHSVHIFNAMRPLGHREPGIVAAILNDDRISAEIITDGIHVHPQVIKILARTKRPHTLVLATDSISAATMPDGEYWLSGLRITVRGGACRDAEGRLAGSSLTQDQALRNLMAWSGLSQEEALATATANPARVLGLDNKGKIETGADADLVLLNDRWEVEQTWVAGQIVYASTAKDNV